MLRTNFCMNYANYVLNRHLPCPKFSMHNFRPRPTHIPNIIKVSHTVPEIYSGQKKTWMADGTRRTDIWITKSLPELSSGETKRHENTRIKHLDVNKRQRMDLIYQFMMYFSDIQLWVSKYATIESLNTLVSCR